MSKGITESVVEQCSLDWPQGLGYEVLSGLAIAPGEPAEERADYKQVFLFDRLQTKLEGLNPKIPLEGLQEALRKLRLIKHWDSLTGSFFLYCTCCSTRESVFLNSHMRVVFRVGDEDSRKLAEGFSAFETEDLRSLGIGEAIARVVLCLARCIERRLLPFTISIPI